MSLIPFQFEGATLRAVDRGEGPVFVAADVCVILDLGNASAAVAKLDEDEKGISSVDTPGGQQDMLVVTEGGLYTLILRCREAVTPGTTPHRFRKWVTSEVLPAIRRTGGYGAPFDPNDPAQLRTLLLGYSERLEAAQRALEAAEPKARLYDHLVNADGLYGLQIAGRVLGQKPNKFVSFLKAGYLFYQGGHLIPRAQYRDMGVFEVKVTTVEDRAYPRTFVTPKGIAYFARKLGVAVPAEGTNA